VNYHYRTLAIKAGWTKPKRSPRTAEALGLIRPGPDGRPIFGERTQ